ncbi:hypothetical protein CROQUDRAFT_100739 [Cronartium quercuum f. sp. fusiforme G11]|uniref:Uncharacterized protein n=1 Tax=Cronartium quercuum f. sp. fusiforme G11 TaxID=708437 RepID=A0A9P6T5R6_9BASI|nr:hypothetical protein CROQUDRAFT_100739 [Cronartium quercuum f. sp. fusiforme G11]
MASLIHAASQSAVPLSHSAVSSQALRLYATTKLGQSLFNVPPHPPFACAFGSDHGFSDEDDSMYLPVYLLQLPPKSPPSSRSALMGPALPLMLRKLAK